MDIENHEETKTRDEVLAVYEDFLEKLLGLAREELGKPDFGKNFNELTQLVKIEGVSEEVSSDIVRVARHIQFLRDKQAAT